MLELRLAVLQSPQAGTFGKLPRSSMRKNSRAMTWSAVSELATSPQYTQVLFLYFLLATDGPPMQLPSSVGRGRKNRPSQGGPTVNQPAG